MLLLTTVGRRTGKTRSVPLLYVRHGNAYVVVASYGGHHHHPDWYHNLAARPATVAQIRGTRVPVTARTASPEERSRIWPLVVTAYDGYRGYQARTTRQIPVVLLEPA